MIHTLEYKPLYDVAGPSEAFPIVFVHGAAWTRNMWMPQMDALSNAFRVIAVDLPGHGARCNQPFQLASAVQTVLDSLKHEANTCALIVGLSLGGYVAMACAHASPQQVAGLVLSGCGIDYRGIVGILSQLDSALATTLFSEGRLTRIQEKSLRRMFPEALIEPQLKAGFSWKAMPRAYREIASHNFPALLHTFPGRVLIMNGEHDTPNRKGEARLLRAVPDTELYIIKDANHLCNLEQPEAFTRQVRTFAKQLSEAPT